MATQKSGTCLVPGGGYKPKKENPDNAVKREVYEELGMRVEATKKLGEYKTSAQGKRDTVDIFLCHASSSTYQKNSEISDVQWVKIEEIQETENCPQITYYALSLM